MITKQLIDGLRTAADWIESDRVEYMWGNPESCNWGIVIQAILNVDKDSLRKLIKSDMYALDICIWSDVPKKITTCKQTGLPLTFIFQKLTELGIKDTDYEYLEFLGGSEKEWRFGVDNTKENTVLFMRTWADSLERELLNQSTKTKTAIKVTVSC
jgi:hypothetical protein